jgi:spermidine synthase
MGVGSFLAKYITKNLLNVFIEVEICLGFIGGLSSILLFLLFEHSTSFHIALYFLVFLTGLLVGIEIPLLMNILEKKVKFKELVSNVFSLDYIGALLASVLFPLFFIPKLGIVSTSLLFGLINISIAITLCLCFNEELKNKQRLLIKSIITFVILSSCLLFSQEILTFSEEKLYGENIIYAHTTPYQRMVITHQKNDYRLYLNNNLQFSSRDEYRYHEALVHPAMSMAPKVDNVLILGGGDGLAVREVLKYKGVKKITLVDLDTSMTNLFKQNKVLTTLNNNSLKHKKVTIINTDAYFWIKNYANNQSVINLKFDVVIIDFPDPSNYGLGKLYSLNFYATLQKVMNPNAVTVIQTTSPYFAPKSFWCVNKTVGQIFMQTTAYHTYVPSFGEWGFNIAINGVDTHFHHVHQQVEQDNSTEELKFYDYNFSKLQYFPPDMIKKQDLESVEINRLDNQVLVRYFDEEWNKL